MRINPSHAGSAAVAACFALTIIVLLTANNGKHSAAVAPVKTAVTTPQTTAAPAIPYSPTPVSPTSTTPQIPTGGTAKQRLLLARVSDVLGQYFLLLPADTAATRRARLRRVISKKILAKLDLRIGQTSLTGKNRQLQQITISGTPVLGELTGVPVEGRPSILIVTVPVTIKADRPGFEPLYSSLKTTSRWQYSQKNWHFLSITEEEVNTG